MMNKTGRQWVVLFVKDFLDNNLDFQYDEKSPNGGNSICDFLFLGVDKASLLFLMTPLFSMSLD
jgi:hypothetical protein